MCKVQMLVHKICVPGFWCGVNAGICSAVVMLVCLVLRPPEALHEALQEALHAFRLDRTKLRGPLAINHSAFLRLVILTQRLEPTTAAAAVFARVQGLAASRVHDRGGGSWRDAHAPAPQSQGECSQQVQPDVYNTSCYMHYTCAWKFMLLYATIHTTK